MRLRRGPAPCTHCPDEVAAPAPPLDKTVDVSAPVRFLDLEVAVYDAPGGDQHYCNDAVPADAPKKTAFLSAASGTVTIKLTSLKSDHDYSIDVTVSGVTIRNRDDLETVADATFSDVRVGWLPG